MMSNRPNKLAIIYGPNGSGKTHLLRRTEGALRKAGWRTLRCCASDFVDQLLDAIRNKVYGQLLTEIRSNRVLLIDDIWILRNKPRTATEVFRILRRSVEDGNCVIVASDLRPSVIARWSEEICDVIKQSYILNINRRRGYKI